MECFELCEISSRTQCSCCSQYWAEGIHRLLHLWDLFDSHRIHKNSTHYPSPYLNCQKGIAPWCSLCENWTASIAKRRIAVRKGKSSIGYIYIDGRESQEATRWTKDTCRHLDWIANEDNSYIATWYEPQGYENILKLDKMHEARMHPWQGEKITPELSRQSKTFRHQDEQASNYPILPSRQTRQRPVEERQWKWSSWSSPSPSSAEWKGSRTRWTSQKWEDYQWFFLQVVPLTGNGDLLVSAGRCK